MVSNLMSVLFNICLVFSVQCLEKVWYNLTLYGDNSLM